MCRHRFRAAAGCGYVRRDRRLARASTAPLRQHQAFEEAEYHRDWKVFGFDWFGQDRIEVAAKFGAQNIGKQLVADNGYLLARQSKVFERAQKAEGQRIERDWDASEVQLRRGI